MNNIHFVEMIIRALPEQILIVLGSYILSQTKFNLKKILLTGTIMGVATYGFRLLPTIFGIHTFLSVALLSILNYKLNKIKLIKSIQVSLLSFILLFVSEIVLVVILQYGIKINLNTAFEDPIVKTLLGIPSLLIFCIFLYIIHRMQNVQDKE